MKCSASKQAGLFLMAVSIRLMAAPAMNSPERPETEAAEAASVSEEGDASDPNKPRPLKPPREPRSQGSELALLVGLGVLATASYAYDTRVSLPGADELRYSGRQRAPGLAFFAGGAFTLPGRLRRITVGAAINAGGPDSNDRSVIPSGVLPPFSKQNLCSDIRDRYSGRLAWGAAFSPFVEHDIGFFHESRVKAGYQYWDQFGSHKGSFASTDGGSLANYNVRLDLRAHLFRMSVNDYIALQDERETSRRDKRRSGMIQQWGIMIGSHQTIMFFAAIGPFWQIAP